MHNNYLWSEPRMDEEEQLLHLLRAVQRASVQARRRARDVRLRQHVRGQDG